MLHVSEATCDFVTSWISFDRTIMSFIALMGFFQLLKFTELLGLLPHLVSSCKKIFKNSMQKEIWKSLVIVFQWVKYGFYQFLLMYSTDLLFSHGWWDGDSCCSLASCEFWLRCFEHYLLQHLWFGQLYIGNIYATMLCWNFVQYNALYLGVRRGF